MRSLPTTLAVTLVAGLAAAVPAFANDSDGSNGFPITLSAPGPQALLDGVSERLKAHDITGASTQLDAAENRVLDESMAGQRPISENVASLRDALPVLDQARQALARGDVATAQQAVDRARAMI